MPSMTEYELTVCMSIMTMSVSAKGTLVRLASEATTKPFVSTLLHGRVVYSYAVHLLLSHKRPAGQKEV